MIHVLFQGLHVYITVWDKDEGGEFVKLDMIDEFDFNFTKPAGSDPVVETFLGVREPPKSRLVWCY